jgi:hypothetical protein
VGRHGASIAGVKLATEPRLDCEDYERSLTTLRTVIAECIHTLPLNSHDRYALLHTITDEYLVVDLEIFEKERTHV